MNYFINSTLVDNQDIYSNDEKVADIFSTFFTNVVNDLNIERDKDISRENINETDPVLTAIKKYDKHPSILKINESLDGQQCFYLRPIEIESIMQEILLLDVCKASPKDSIPPKVIKDNYDIFSYKLTNGFNFSVNSGISR